MRLAATAPRGHTRSPLHRRPVDARPRPEGRPTRQEEVIPKRFKVHLASDSHVRPLVLRTTAGEGLSLHGYR